MRNHEKLKKILGLLLCCFMVLGMLPDMAHAAVSASLEVLKTDKEGCPLSGAEFILTEINDDGEPASEPAYSAVSQADGRAVFTNMEDGEYILSELTAPEGYIRSDETYSLIVRNGVVYEKPDDNEDLVYEFRQVTYMNIKEPTSCQFTVKKTDTNGNPLQGATFSLTGTGNSVGKDYTAVSDQDGIATFDAPEGYYTLTESVAPEGYVKSDESYEISVFDGKVYLIYVGDEYGEYSDYQQVTFVNEKLPTYQFTVKKTDTNGNPLQGATFSLTGTGNSVGKNYTAVSGQDGIAVFDALEGFYTLTESAAPEGYVKSDESYEISIHDGKVFLMDGQDGNGSPQYINYQQVTFVNEKEPVVTVAVPFIKEVVQNGEKVPGTETFRFELISDTNIENAKIQMISNTVVTNGKGNFNGELKFTVPVSKMVSLMDGFYIREVKGNADGWTYSDAVYLVVPYVSDTANVPGFSGFSYYGVSGNQTDGFLIDQTPLNELRFINSYNKAEEVTTIKPTEPNTTSGTTTGTTAGTTAASTKTTIQGVETGDSSNMFLWIGLLFVSAAGVFAMMFNRKSRHHV